MNRWHTLGGLGSAIALMGACASMDNSLSASGAESGRAFPGDPAGTTTPGAGATADGGFVEAELESLYEAPVATGRYVWTANSRSGRVALVDVTSLAVTTLEVGNQPTSLAALPPTCAAPCDDDRVIVLNVGSKDATVVAVTGGAAAASLTLPVPSGGNQWRITPDGRFAIAWTDARRVDKPQKTQGFQDITVLDLTSRTSTTLSVGYRPVAIAYAASSSRAFAVTQDGISVVELLGAGAPKVGMNIPISSSPLEDPGTRDVSFTPDGTLALVRRDGSSAITVVSLDAGTRKDVTLPDEVTDLDVSQKGDFAVAVVRKASTVAVLPLPGIWTAPDQVTKLAVPSETFGAVSLGPSGARGVLYTGETSVEQISVLDLAPLATRAVRLYSPVLAAFVADDAAHALIFHPSSPSGAGQVGAFSLVPLAETLPAKIVQTLAPPMNVAFAPESDRAVVTLRDDRTKVYGAAIAHFPSLAVDTYSLSSPPTAAGIAARARRAFIAQEHPEGRITFIDLATGQARTLTGFELAARVVDGARGR